MIPLYPNIYHHTIPRRILSHTLRTLHGTWSSASSQWSPCAPRWSWCVAAAPWSTHQRPRDESNAMEQCSKAIKSHNVLPFYWLVDMVHEIYLVMDCGWFWCSCLIKSNHQTTIVDQLISFMHLTSPSFPDYKPYQQSRYHTQLLSWSGW